MELKPNKGKKSPKTDLLYEKRKKKNKMRLSASGVLTHRTRVSDPVTHLPQAGSKGQA